METRYHRTYDGSLHFSFKLPNENTIFGALFRYYDQFTHYALRFNTKLKRITLELKNPFNS